MSVLGRFALGAVPAALIGGALFATTPATLLTDSSAPS
jgi:hypothetical protein